MWSKRKLCGSALALLRRELLFSPCRPIDFLLDPQSPRGFTRSSLLLRCPRVPGSNLDQLLHQSRVSLSFSYSSESDGGRSSSCWNCGADPSSLPFLSCGSCRSVQPVDKSVDFFQIFGLEREYKIKDGNLESKYKDWQKKLHPDLVHSKSEKEKSFAAEQSARVIDAYRTLGKPLSRAIYLLQLEGIIVDEEKTITDPDLLAEMMEIRESVDEANDSHQLKQIQSQLQSNFETWSNSFHGAFEKREFDDAMASIQRMRYYERAMEAIIKKL